MASITIQLTNVCSGGGHGTITVSGDVTRSLVVDFAELLEEIGAVDDKAILAALLRLNKIGKTNAQFKSSLLAGIAVTV